MKIRKSIKLGHQAPKGYVNDVFNRVDINGDFAYCSSHNFVYNTDDEKRKLYNGQPCRHTDKRFYDGRFNSYKSDVLHWTRWREISLKSCIRRVNKCKNIPVGTIVDFSKSWYHPGTKVDNSYVFKVKKENKLDIQYEVNIPSFSANFTNCEFSKNLTNALRENGFLVKVMKNESFLGNMINDAKTFTGGELNDTTIDGEVAIAYGYGKMIGFSSFDNDFMGYADGIENILFDFFGEFDKWSRCKWINKASSLDDIINDLKKPNEEV